MVKKTAAISSHLIYVNDLIEKRERTHARSGKETREVVRELSQPAEVDRPQRATAQELGLQTNWRGGD